MSPSEVKWSGSQSSIELHLLLPSNSEKKMAKDLDTTWKALADSTRRSILDELRDGPKTTTALVEKFPELSRFGVMKHIDVLREANLINTRSEGRKRINSLNVNPIRQILERWIHKYEAYWANNLLRIKEEAETSDKKTSKTKKKKA